MNFELLVFVSVRCCSIFLLLKKLLVKTSRFTDEETALLLIRVILDYNSSKEDQRLDCRSSRSKFDTVASKCVDAYLTEARG